MKINRRSTLKQILGATMATSALRAGQESAMAKGSEEQKNKAEKTGMPYGTIGDLRISRLILGSNTPGAHSRDLLYVSALARAYNTKERMLDTFELAESQGINTVLQGNPRLIQEYNATRGGNLRQIRPLGLRKEHDRGQIAKFLAQAMDENAAAVYVMGDRGDYLVREKRVDVIGMALDVAKELGVLLGVGGHSLRVVTECEKNGIKPAFYVKTFHHDNYWSATPKEYREDFCWYDDQGGNSYSGKTGDHNRFHDNIWCLDPEDTIDVMKKVKAPWIAFKVLAAGAIHPREGFEFAFRNGADFIAVGMCDFQIRGNASLVMRYAGMKDRDRPWQA